MRIVFFIRSFILLIVITGFFACQPKAPATDKEPVQLKIDFAEALMIYQAQYLWNQMDKKQQTAKLNSLIQRFSSSEQEQKKADSAALHAVVSRDTCYCYDKSTAPLKTRFCENCEPDRNPVYIGRENSKPDEYVCFDEVCADDLFEDFARYVIDPGEDCGNGDCLKKLLNNFKGDMDPKDPIGPIPNPPVSTTNILFDNVPAGINIKAVRLIENWTTSKQNGNYTSGNSTTTTFNGNIEVDFEIDNNLFTDMRFNIRQ